MCSECAICIENISENCVTIKPYMCVHVFHEKCVEKWDGNCPCCRSKKIDLSLQKLLDKYSVKVGDMIIIKYKNSRYMNKGIFSSFYKYNGYHFLVLDESRIVDYDRGVEDQTIGTFGFRIDDPSGENIEFINILNN